MSTSLLSLLPAGLVADRVVVHEDRVVVTVRARTATAACPACRRSSRRVHSRYGRRLSDLPWQGRAGELHLLVRRFRCVTANCPRRLFAERLPAVALPRVRRTARLAEAQRRIGLSAGGEPGARLATRLAMPVSGDTVRRLIRTAPIAPPPPPPRVIGIDDGAWRRGQRYGTLIVDLERNRPVDLLPDRQAKTGATWLRAHPGVEIVARDRAGAYADGVRQGAPTATQVADRWHLLRNLGDVWGAVLTGYQGDLRAAGKAALTPPATPPASEPTPPACQPWPPTRQQQRRSAIHAARQARYEEVARLHARGWSQTRIAQTLSLDRKTVRVWLRAGQPPSWCQPAKGSVLDPYADHLRRRWEEGCRNAAQLWREIRERGFPGRPSLVRAWLRPLRRGNPGLAAPASVSWRTPSRRRTAWLVVAEPEEIDTTERAFVAALMARSPKLARLVELARGFRARVRERRADRLDAWLESAANTTRAGFVDGLKRDLAAVRAALSLSWSTGPVEGQISRLKTIKRQMNGRAGFDLLRPRILAAA